MYDLKTKYKNTAIFFKTDIWRIRKQDFSHTKAFIISTLRIFFLAMEKFTKDNCGFRASALTFYTLLSIVPVAALAFGVARGFGFEKLLEAQLLEKFQSQEQAIQKIIFFSTSLLENTKGSFIAGIGLIALIWTMLKVLGNIEHSFNVIWEVNTSRKFFRKLGDYLSIMLICPLLAIMSGSITVFITTMVNSIGNKLFAFEVITPLIFLTLKFLPYVLIWILFTMIYIAMPNIKIKFLSGFAAGIIAGTIYQLAQWTYIQFQFQVSHYNAIYGSFAALPLFFFWLQLSWLIVLFGAEISYACENADTYEREQDSLEISYFYKQLLSISVVHLVIKNFTGDKKLLTSSEISANLGIPVRLLKRILNDLIRCDVIARSYSNCGKFTYQPASDINKITITSVIYSLGKKGQNSLCHVAETDQQKALSASLNKLSNQALNSSENRLIKDI